MRLLQNATSDENSPLWNLKNSEIEARDGRLTSKSEPSKSVAYVDILRRYRKNVVEQEGGARPGLERGEAGGPGAVAGAQQEGKSQNAYSMHGFGAQFCEVRVDRDIATLRVARWTGVFALGKVLNSKTLRSQLQGGIVWGIGMGLMEESLIDPRYGRYVNSNLAEYHVPLKSAMCLPSSGSPPADLPSVQASQVGIGSSPSPTSVLRASPISFGRFGARGRPAPR